MQGFERLHHARFRTRYQSFYAITESSAYVTPDSSAIVAAAVRGEFGVGDAASMLHVHAWHAAIVAVDEDVSAETPHVVTDNGSDSVRPISSVNDARVRPPDVLQVHVRITEH